MLDFCLIVSFGCTKCRFAALRATLAVLPFGLVSCSPAKQGLVSYLRCSHPAFGWQVASKGSLQPKVASKGGCSLPIQAYTIKGCWLPALLRWEGCSQQPSEGRRPVRRSEARRKHQQGCFARGSFPKAGLTFVSSLRKSQFLKVGQTKASQVHIYKKKNKCYNFIYCL